LGGDIGVGVFGLGWFLDQSFSAIPAHLSCQGERLHVLRFESHCQMLWSTSFALGPVIWALTWPIGQLYGGGHLATCGWNIVRPIVLEEVRLLTFIEEETISQRRERPWN
jgi:hypothetical protein